MNPQRRAAGAFLLPIWLAAVCVSTAGLVGDLSETRGEDADRFVNPVELNDAASIVLHLSSAVVAFVGIVVIARALRSGGTDRAVAAAALPWAGVAAYVGYGYCVFTAGVIGANIGAGLMLFALPVVLVVATALSVLAWNLTRRAERTTN